MTTSTDSRTGDQFAGLVPEELLALVVDADTAERRAGLAKLELALEWCLSHPVVDPSQAGAVAVWGDAGIPGTSEWDDTLGGDGTPLVAAFATEPFATALGVSHYAGMQLLADALDLAYRLPRTWALARALGVAPWKARRLAQATHQLSAEAAAYVDAQLVRRIDSCGAVLIDRTVAQAAAKYDPQAQEAKEESKTSSWGVRLTHPDPGCGGFAGTSSLDITGDTVDLTTFYDLVCDTAAHLARLGDPDTLEARKAKAVGVIADAQNHLDLYGSAPDQDGPKRSSLTRARFYVHLDGSDLLDPLQPVGVGEVEKLGPATLTKMKEWIGSTKATIVPVINLGDDRPVDVHDPPEAMRDQVILRDRHCVFPWCGVDARVCDLDHIEPYLPPDEGGPPGQTRPSNLACLCRRHHNAKTSRRWSYARNRDGTYTWHGPHGASYLVTPFGTTPLPHA
jgi:hypothetical protein